MSVKLFHVNLKLRNPNRPGSSGSDSLRSLCHFEYWSVFRFRIMSKYGWWNRHCQIYHHWVAILALHPFPKYELIFIDIAHSLLFIHMHTQIILVCVLSWTSIAALRGRHIKNGSQEKKINKKLPSNMKTNIPKSYGLHLFSHHSFSLLSCSLRTCQRRKKCSALWKTSD